MDGTETTTSQPSARVTAADVAMRVGVSRSTVSRAFTPGRSVGADARTRILAAARDLGYEPDGLAKALISGRSGIVGILMGELENPIHAVLHQAIGLRLQQHGLIPISAQVRPGIGTEEIVAIFRRYRAEAVILTSMHVSPELVGACRDAGLRVLLLNRIDEVGQASSVCADIRQGGRLAAEHLLSTGRRRIAIAKGVAGSWTAETRLAGHFAGLEARGVGVRVVLDGGYGYDDGAGAAEAVAASGCDGMLCPNDLFGIGLMDALRGRFGCRIPDDIAVVGFDDIPMAAWQSYALTTVRLPIEEMADRGLQAIVERAINEPVQEWVPCQLIMRHTT